MPNDDSPNDQDDLPDLQEYAWNEGDWEVLLLSIEEKSCTPFLGAGACAGYLPTAESLAEEWALLDGFPFKEGRSLDRVAQYVATKTAPQVPKFRIAAKFRELKKLHHPNFDDPNYALRIIARLRQPIYLTTNYDDYMAQAIEKEINHAPDIAFCEWHKPRAERKRLRGLAPTPERPLVYHLHGVYQDPKSIVVTEDDYLDFLAQVIDDKGLMPPAIDAAFGNSMFLFIGYSLADMNFRILFKKLAMYLGANSFKHAAVQLGPGKKGETRESRVQQLKYLNKRYESLKIKVFWGDAGQFAQELMSRITASIAVKALP
jgi:hypothetical protein